MTYDDRKGWSRVCERVRELRALHESILNHPSTFALFGAGRYGRVAMKQVGENGSRVRCFVDNAPQKQGSVIDGIPVVGPQDPLLHETQAVLICVRGFYGGLNLTAPQLSYDAWYILQHLGQFERIREHCLVDLRSKQTLDAVLSAILFQETAEYTKVYESQQYFCLPGFRNVSEEVFVDVGAYVGDSVEKFLWANEGLCRSIIAFEPGQRQYLAAQKRLARLVEEWALNPQQIQLVHAGVGRHDDEMTAALSSERLSATHLAGSSATNATNLVPMTTLDRYLDGRPITLLKADIEGMELDMLHGAENTIKRHRPKLAICVYHNLSDLIDVVNLVQTMVPAYKMALRHHSLTHCETVLYCWVD